MVIANSDSNTTLVSLNNNDKHIGNDQNIVVDGETGLLRYVEPSASTATPARVSPETITCCSDGGVPTELLISVPDRWSSSSTEAHVPMYLPLQEQKDHHVSLDVDEYLSQNYYGIDTDENGNIFDQPKAPSNLMPGAQTLKESRERLLASKSRKRCSGRRGEQSRNLYVAQGERANATSQHYDVMMSDKATTCHILAFRSTTSSTSNHGCESDLPLTSLTHLDGPQYEQCVREMVQEHIDHHRCENSRNKTRRKRTKFAEEKKSDDCREPNYDSNGNLLEQVNIDIHVMGGFDDIESSSSSITDWLMRLLARMAQEFKDQRVGVQMVVKTLVVSSSNNEVDAQNNDCPIGRGLGIDLRTGEVFLTDSQNEKNSGPAPVLRSVRLWSRCCSSNDADHLQSNRLSVVHTTKAVNDLWASIGVDEDDDVRKEYSLFWVQPFKFRPINNIDVLLGLPDELLLQYTSTSPDVEEAGFCDDVRASMEFLKHHCITKKEDGRSYFGASFDQPMVFAMRNHGAKKSGEPKPVKWNRLSL